jgi:hypothetical protein
VQLAATPETPVGEILDRACAELGIDDPGRHALVARGEVLGDRGRPVGELAAEELGSGLSVRLVRKPEAGIACRSC